MADDCFMLVAVLFGCIKRLNASTKMFQPYPNEIQASFRHHEHTSPWHSARVTLGDPALEFCLCSCVGQSIAFERCCFKVLVVANCSQRCSTVNMQGEEFVPLIINGFDVSVYFDFISRARFLSPLSQVGFSSGGQCWWHTVCSEFQAGSVHTLPSALFLSHAQACGTCSHLPVLSPCSCLALEGS